MGTTQFERACVANWRDMVTTMDQQHVERIVGDRIEWLVGILGEEVGAIQLASDRKMAAELKRVQISFAAVWEELNTLRDKIAHLKNDVPRSPATQLDHSANANLLRYARAS